MKQAVTTKLKVRYMTRKTYLFPRNSVVVPRGRRGTSARAPRNFRTGGHRFRTGGSGFSMRVGVDLLCGWARIFCAEGHESSVRIQVENGRNQKANFVRNDKGSRNMLQGSFEISL